MPKIPGWNVLCVQGPHLGIIRCYFNIKRKDICYLNTSTVHSLLVISQIHGRSLKINMSHSVNVIHLRTDHKLMPICFYRKQKEIKNVLEGSGKISKLKNTFLQRSVLLQAIMILKFFFCNLKILYTIQGVPPQK